MVIAALRGTWLGDFCKMIQVAPRIRRTMPIIVHIQGSVADNRLLAMVTVFITHAATNRAVETKARPMTSEFFMSDA